MAGIFLLLAIIVIVFPIFIGIDYLSYQSQEAKLSQWQSLAAIKKLNFNPGKWAVLSSSDPSVHGNYRDCQLGLTIFQKSQGKTSVTYTQVSVRSDQRVTAKVDLAKFPLGQQLTYYKLKS